jgi:hypothetical protein
VCDSATVLTSVSPSPHSLFLPFFLPQEKKEAMTESLTARRESEEVIESKVMEMMQEQMEKLDNELHVKYQVTQAQLMEAQNTYSEDAVVGALMRTLKQLVLGEEQAAMFEAMAKMAPPDMTADKFVALFRIHSDFVEAKLGELFGRAAKETVGRSPEEKDSYMQMLFSRHIDQLQAAAQAKTGVSDEAFKGSMIKFGQDARVMQIMNASHERQDKMRVSFYESR